MKIDIYNPPCLFDLISADPPWALSQCVSIEFGRNVPLMTNLTPCQVLGV